VRFIRQIETHTRNCFPRAKAFGDTRGRSLFLSHDRGTGCARADGARGCADRCVCAEGRPGGGTTSHGGVRVCSLLLLFSLLFSSATFLSLLLLPSLRWVGDVAFYLQQRQVGGKAEGRRTSAEQRQQQHALRATRTRCRYPRRRCHSHTRPTSASPPPRAPPISLPHGCDAAPCPLPRTGREPRPPVPSLAGAAGHRESGRSHVALPHLELAACRCPLRLLARHGAKRF